MHQCSRRPIKTAIITTTKKILKGQKYDLTCPQYGQILVVQSCIPWNHRVFIAEEAEGVKPIGQCHNDHILIGYQIRARNVFWIAQCEELACKTLPSFWRL